MALLGPTSTVDTIVRGTIGKGGVISGDLYLVGGADPNLDSNDLPYTTPSQRPKDAANPRPFRDLESLADQLVAKGVKRVKGKIIGETDFEWEPYPIGWEADDLTWGYGAPVSGLTIADNQLKLTVTPGKSAPQAPERFLAPSVALEQNEVPFYQLSVQALTNKFPESNGVDIDREPGSRTLRVYGFMLPDSKPDVEEIAITDPDLYAAMAFRNILLAKGIVVSGDASTEHRPPFIAGGFLSRLHAPLTCADMLYPSGPQSCLIVGITRSGIPAIATHTSDPLADDVKFTLKESQNLHAELMLRRLGKLPSNGHGNTIEGARIVAQFLLHAGLDPGDFLFYDGSGLSTHDLVAPRATAKLLSFATTQPWFAQWKASLPIGGVDGSLEHRFTEAPLKGHVFAKTGTLGESRALSGYLDCASGKQVIFSIMVDNHLPGTPADRTTMDKIVAAIAATQ